MAKVLVIEDSDVTRLMVVKMLEKVGHETIEAANGNKGLIKTIFAPPDLIILDINMPEMNGVEFLWAMTEAEIKVPVIVITANTLEDTKKQCEEIGVTNFLYKPVQKETLLSAVEQALNSDDAA